LAKDLQGISFLSNGAAQASFLNAVCGRPNGSRRYSACQEATRQEVRQTAKAKDNLKKEKRGAGA